MTRLPKIATLEQDLKSTKKELVKLRNELYLVQMSGYTFSTYVVEGNVLSCEQMIKTLTNLIDQKEKKIMIKSMELINTALNQMNEGLNKSLHTYLIKKSLTERRN